jgi:hypothetical protein
MSWLNFDWLKHETEVFLDEMKTITSVYDRMFDEFDAAYKKHESEAKDTADAEYMIDMLSWNVEVRKTQQRILTTMILAVTCRSIEELLRRCLTYFFKNDEIKESTAGSNIWTWKKKFAEIGVDLDDQQEFKTIQEMVEARNCCVHNNNAPDERYLQRFPNPQWHDDPDKISIRPDEWKELTAKLSKWAEDLSGRLRASKSSRKAQGNP